MSPFDLFTDSSVCSSRKLVCSAFVVRSDNRTVHESTRIYSGSCNNHGEMVAIEEALTWIRDGIMCSKVDSYYPCNHIYYIKTDSLSAIESINYCRQGISLSIRQKYLSLKFRLEKDGGSIHIVRVNRSQVTLAHALARRRLKQELDKLSGGKEKNREEKKRIERAWILSRWLEMETEKSKNNISFSTPEG